MTRTVAVGLRAQRTLATRRQVVRGISANRSAYDARRRRSPRTDETKLYMDLIRFDPCMLCKQPPDEGGVQDVDHIVPLLAGGLDTWENMTAACLRCNRGRRDRSLLESLLLRGERRARPR